MCNFVVITLPADGLAPIGARPSAGMVMVRLIYKHRAVTSIIKAMGVLYILDNTE